MGSPAGRGNEDEWPQHQVYLPEYYIDVREVTFQQFAAFIEASGYQTKGNWRAFYRKGADRYPAMDLACEDAAAYCQWAGSQRGPGWTGRLPSEAEWEKAARGPDYREFPWGDTWDAHRCNSADLPLAEGMLDVAGKRGPMPVGSFPEGRSPYGLDDCAGNVWEWTRSLYRAYPYQAEDGREAGDTGADRVLRGGSWGESRVAVRTAQRRVASYHYRFENYGCRCVYYHSP